MRLPKLFIALLFCVSVSYSQNIDGITIAKTIKLNSAILGEERTIYISTPAGYFDTDKSYPVLYVLDGWIGVIGLANNLSDFGSCPEMIVVVIGEVNSARDMFPSAPKYKTGTQPVKPWFHKKENDELRVPQPGEKCGEADKFLSFIESELFPYVEKNYRTVPYRICSGHSSGGLCVTHSFLSHNNMFNSYIALSPSLYWDAGLVMKTAEEKLAGMDLRHKQFYFTVGGNEIPSTIGDAHSFAEIIKLKASSDLKWKLDYLENEDHGSGAIIGLINGLRFIFNGWKYDTDKMIAGGINAIDAFYAGLTEKYGYKVSADVGTLNSLGWQILRGGRQEDAMKIFNENVKRHPDSPDAYNLLAEGYLKGGQTEMAIKTYEKAVELATGLKDSKADFYKRRIEMIKADNK